MKNDLRFLHDDNGTFVDHSSDTNFYLEDKTPIVFTALNNKLYIGLYKPFSAVYVELDTPSAIDAELVFKIEREAGLGTIEPSDRTKGFRRSGFIRFDHENDFVESEINGVSKYWLEVNSNLDFTIIIAGINIVYSDDNDLREKIRNIDVYKAKDDNSFIAYHLAAQKEIIDDINNRKYKLVNCEIAHFNQWDLLDFGEIREASTYLALSKIFFEVSANKQDKSAMRADSYDTKYRIAFNKYFITLDKNDNGLKEPSDKTKNKTRFMTR